MTSAQPLSKPIRLIPTGTRVRVKGTMGGRFAPIERVKEYAILRDIDGRTTKIYHRLSKTYGLYRAEELAVNPTPKGKKL